MAASRFLRSRISDRDLSFLLETTAPSVSDRHHMKEVLESDMGIESLLQFAEAADEEHRLWLYKRIGDVCLFLLGIFPNFIETEFRCPFSGKPRPALPGRPRLSAAEYEAQRRQFYRKAAKHHSATELELAAVFWKLHTEFETARKPLTYIADHYLRHRRSLLFG